MKRLDDVLDRGICPPPPPPPPPVLETVVSITPPWKWWEKKMIKVDFSEYGVAVSRIIIKEFEEG